MNTAAAAATAAVADVEAALAALRAEARGGPAAAAVTAAQPATFMPAAHNPLQSLLAVAEEIIRRPSASGSAADGAAEGSIVSAGGGSGVGGGFALDAAVREMQDQLVALEATLPTEVCVLLSHTHTHTHTRMSAGCKGLSQRACQALILKSRVCVCVCVCVGVCVCHAG